MSLEGNERKPGRLRTRILVLLAITVAGVACFKWFTAATPVSKYEALQIFEEDNASAGAQTIDDDLKAKRDRRRDNPHRPRGPRNSGGREAGTRREPRAGSPRKPGSEQTGSDPVVMPPMVVPAEGVYAYRTEGGEQIPGYERRFPSSTYRNVVHTGSRSWTEHHTFLQEHQGWSSFRSDGTAVLVDWTRQRVVFGPVVEDETLQFHTPLLLSWMHFEEGRRWEGELEGETDDGPFQGFFSASTGTSSRLQVGDEVVRVWLEEMSMELHGQDFDATLELRRWISPEYGVTVREEVVADARKGVLTYTAEWSLDLLSIRPER